MLHQFVTPVVVGGGQPWLAADVRLDLELRDEHRFSDGVVHLAYGVVDRQTLTVDPSRRRGAYVCSIV